MFDYNRCNEWFIPAAEDVYLKYTTNQDGLWGTDGAIVRGSELPDEVKARPEYLLGQKVEIDNDVENMYVVYKTLVEACARVRAFLNKALEDKVQKKIDAIMNWLDNTDMKTSPASTVYHESVEGGLVVHTLKVFNQMIDVHKIPVYTTITQYHSAALVALVHDWCKIGRYESYIRNVKNEETGQWDKVKCYKRKDALLPLGHGVASLFQAAQCFALNPEEALAIRWHMSHWNAADNEVDELQQANETAPLVHMIQFADALAITKYANLTQTASN